MRAATLRRRCAIVVALLAPALVAPASAAAFAPVATELGSFALPTYVTAAPGDSTGLYVVERAGRIKLLRGGVTKTFLDASAQVDIVHERGMLSVAFAPDYAASGLLYTYETELPAVAGGSSDNHVVEWRRDPSDPDRVDPASEREVLTIPHPGQNNHNGGQLQFGPDGRLWIASGDGGGTGDPNHLAQNRNDLRGKLLRIDPRPVGGDAYGIPPDNPFVGIAGAKPEVWAYGLRNPWRFSFDRTTQDLWIADVGQDTTEELDLATKASGWEPGANDGWSCREGLAAYSGAPAGCPSLGFTDPVMTYPHENGRCAITGGYVVRADDLPSWTGRYLFSDYCDGIVRARDVAGTVQPVGLALANPVSFGEDGCGHLYAVGNGGKVWRLSEATPPPACPTPPDPPPPVPPDVVDLPAPAPTPDPVPSAPVMPSGRKAADRLASAMFTGAVAAPKVLSGLVGATVVAPVGVAHGVLSVDPRARSTRLLAVGCDASCTVTVRAALALRRTRAALVRTVRRQSRAVTLAAGHATLAHLQLTARQRRLLIAAYRADLVLKITVRTAGVSRTVAATIRLKRERSRL